MKLYSKELILKMVYYPVYATIKYLLCLVGTFWPFTKCLKFLLLVRATYISYYLLANPIIVLVLFEKIEANVEL
jgi:hypothetical protein